MVNRSSFSRNSRSNRVAVGMLANLSCGVRGDAADDGGEHGFGGLPVRMGVKVQNDAMPEHRRSDTLDVLYAEVITAAHERVHAAAFDQRLRAAGRAAV